MERRGEKEVQYNFATNMITIRLKLSETKYGFHFF